MRGYIFAALLFSVNGYSHSLSISHKAKVTSSKASSRARCLTDGIIGIENLGTWRSRVENAEVRMAWDEPQYVNKVVIFNSPSEQYRVKKCELVFSDGSTETVTMSADGTATAAEFDERLTDFILFRIKDGQGDVVELSEIEVYSSPSQYTEPVEWVDPYIETDRGRFFFFITGQRPYGMVGAAPMTVNGNNCGGGYAHYSDEVLGFPQIHAWTISGLNLMPTVADVDPVKGEKEWKSPFRHDDEIVQPGYHRMYLSKSKVWVEQTATERVSFYRFKWTDNAGAPWLTQYWVRQVNEKAYGGTTPELGYGGHDEDQGQMGGVSSLMSIGLFNILGNESLTPFYEITAPVFDKVTIKLDGRYYAGKEFVIKTYNNSAENCYIQKAKLNGEELDDFWFTHEQYAAGGILEIWLGDTPDKRWGTVRYPPVTVE